jgi:hypothetical protein
LNFGELSFTKYTNHSLETALPHLLAAMAPRRSCAGVTVGVPECAKRLHHTAALPNVAVLKSASCSEDIVHALCTVEWWVRVYLWPAVTSYTSSTSSSSGSSSSASSSDEVEAPYSVPELLQLLTAYHSRAAACYKQDPESNSRMVLAVFTMTAAMDMLASHQYPLLAKKVQLWH